MDCPTKTPSLAEAVELQRQTLKSYLSAPMKTMSASCSEVIDNNSELEKLLEQQVNESGICKHLWVVDRYGKQITATYSKGETNELARGRDRVARPYMQRALKGEPFYLSEAYISRNLHRPSLTSVQEIKDENEQIVGYLGADFDLRELPHTSQMSFDQTEWQQIKGDPAIRGGLFAQQRTVSAMDDQLDEVLALIEELILAHGVFHAKLHFSSSRATVWLVDNPFDYQILSIDVLTDPGLCLAFPKRQYFSSAKVAPEKVRQVFAQFKKLRFADETIYLRSASLNIVNEKVGLNFSCDGSHYMNYEEFLSKDNQFWFGVNSDPS